MYRTVVECICSIFKRVAVVLDFSDGNKSFYIHIVYGNCLLLIFMSSCLGEVLE